MAGVEGVIRDYLAQKEDLVCQLEEGTQALRERWREEDIDETMRADNNNALAD